MTHYHPRKNDKGQPVALHSPSHPTGMETWSRPDQIATVTPDAPMPADLNGLPIASWSGVPTDSGGWERLALSAKFDEPPLKSVVGKAPASGAVVVEPDGRVWVVSPSNGFGGYTNTFPKGKPDPKEGLSLKANAVKEVFEEAGLQVELTGFLCDSERSTSVTRYFLAQRIYGSPATMGWESQAVSLVPTAQLHQFISHANDESIVQAIRARKVLVTSDIAGVNGLGSVKRILAAIAGFKRMFGHWPTRILVDRDMLKGIPGYAITDLGWEMLNRKLDLVAIDEGTVFAEGAPGERFEYADQSTLKDGPSVTFWIWGVTFTH